MTPLRYLTGGRSVSGCKVGLRQVEWPRSRRKKNRIKYKLFSFIFCNWREFKNSTGVYCGPGSYGLDGPGSNSGGDEIFLPSRPALGPTQPPVKRAAGL